MPELNFTRGTVHGKLMSPHFQPVISKLQQLYGDRLELISMDDNVLNFRVAGLTESVLLLELQHNLEAILGNDLYDFHFVTPINARQVEGVEVRWIGTADLKSDRIPGCWFS
jgi:hypothetical protein